MARFTHESGAMVVLLATATLVLWCDVNLGGDTTTLAVIDLANAGAAFLAAWACLRRRGLETEERPRRGWTALGLGCLAWGLGAAYITWFDLVTQHGVPFELRPSAYPSIADLGYLAFVPFALAAIVWLPQGIFRRQLRLMGLVDGMIMATAVMAIAWRFALSDMTAAADPGFETYLLLAYPISDIFLASSVLVMLTSMPPDERHKLRIVGGGLILFALADTGYYALIQSDVVGVSSVNALWPAGFLCIMVGAWGMPAPSAQEVKDRNLHLVVPAMAGLALVVELASSMAEHADIIDAILVALLGIACLVRLGWTLLEARRVRRVARQLQQE